MLNSIDASLFRFFNGFAGKSDLLNSIIIFLANYLSYFLILVLIIFVWKYVQSKKQMIIVTFVSVILSRFVITEIIRFIYERPRPFLALHVHQLIPEKGGSFPSGHASFFFAIAAAVYFYNKKWGIGFFIAAILIGVGRVMAGVHYPLDILGGAVIGTIIAYIIFKLVKNLPR